MSVPTHRLFYLFEKEWWRDLIDKSIKCALLQPFKCNIYYYKMALLQVVFKICLIIFMYEGVLSSDNPSKRILLGDADYIDGRLRQMEMTMNAKIQEIEAKCQTEMQNKTGLINAKVQEIEAKTHIEIQNLTNTIHFLQQKGKFLFVYTLSRQTKFKKCLKIPKGQSEAVKRRRTNNTMAKNRTNTDLQNTIETTND